MDFTFAFYTTIIRLKLTDIYLYYVAQVFLPPPVPNVHNRGAVPDRVKNQVTSQKAPNRCFLYLMNNVVGTPIKRLEQISQRGHDENEKNI